MTTENLSMLGAAADLVTRDNATLNAAKADLVSQQALLLEEVVTRLRGCWRALSSRVGIGTTISRAGTTTEHASWAGIYLAGDGPKWVQGPDPLRGRYGGTRLFLRADGVLVELSYDGVCSSVPGEVSSWKATETSPNHVEIVSRYDLVKIIDEIIRALEGQKDGRAAERAAQMRAEAECIRAARSLLRKRR